MNINPLFRVVLAVLCLSSCGAFADSVTFGDATESAGIRFTHVDGRSGQRYFMETLGSGAAFFDYDNDGDPDLYLVNGAPLPGHASPEIPTNHLYRNNGDGTFADVTEQAGVGDTGYGHGCCVGDYDNDGDLDLYVTNYGRNVLYRNDGDGTFTDITAQAGVECPLWSTSAAFCDYDRDGDLDLYVANYIEFDIEENPFCGFKEKGIRAYCEPNAFPGQSGVLYRNNGDGTFADVSQAAGVHRPDGKGLGVVWGDYDNDGFPDLYVANDSTPNFLFRNQGDGTFEEIGFIAGVAVSENGATENGMGTAFGDYDNDGWLDLTVTNYANQTNTLLHNDGDGFFSDATNASGTGHVTHPFLGWATEFLDYDNDGWLDVFVSNGHLHDNLAELGQEGTYAQRNLLFRNHRNGTFGDVSRSSGAGMALEEVSRGAAFADYDRDGDTDILVTNSHGSARLLRNDGGNSANWLSILLVGTGGSSDAIGTRISVTAGGVTEIREVRSGTGYLSQNELPLLFGLGGESAAEKIEIRWATGKTETHENVTSRQRIRIMEGSGISNF